VPEDGRVTIEMGDNQVASVENTSEPVDSSVLFNCMTWMQPPALSSVGDLHCLESEIVSLGTRQHVFERQVWQST
jgi:hypothetical protein